MFTTPKIITGIPHDRMADDSHYVSARGYGDISPSAGCAWLVRTAANCFSYKIVASIRILSTG